MMILVRDAAEKRPSMVSLEEDCVNRRIKLSKSSWSLDVPIADAVTIAKAILSAEKRMPRT